MNISKFITQNMEPILVEWEAFAATFGAVVDNMSSIDLRDHARQILQFVAVDVQKLESEDETQEKSQGLQSAHLRAAGESASSIHGRLRYSSGFTLVQLIAEYRALRASVLKLWQRECADISAQSVQDMMRFNAAIDQSLAEAAVAYSDKLNDTRETFIAVLGHDLRSPLALTSTAGSYLSRPGAFEEKVKEVGVRVKRSATTMTGIVDDLLALARTQLGDGITIDPQPCDLLEMCHWAVEDANAAHPRAKFEINATGDLSGLFDRPRLQQLLTNLANNAAQYGTPGEPIIVGVRGEEKQVVLTVSNKGPVIPKEQIPTLFNSLVRLAQTEATTEQQHSLGLGLFIAKQIAISHGGTIEATSDEVAGTVFTVTIPRA